MDPPAVGSMRNLGKGGSARAAESASRRVAAMILSDIGSIISTGAPSVQNLLPKPPKPLKGNQHAPYRPLSWLRDRRLVNQHQYPSGGTLSVDTHANLTACFLA